MGQKQVTGIELLNGDGLIHAISGYLDEVKQMAFVDEETLCRIPLGEKIKGLVVDGSRPVTCPLCLLTGPMEIRKRTGTRKAIPMTTPVPA